MLLTWFCTVRLVMTISLAIASLSRPRASRQSTSISRGVRPGCSGAGEPTARRTTLRATAGLSQLSPQAAARTAPKRASWMLMTVIFSMLLAVLYVMLVTWLRARGGAPARAASS